MEKAPVRWEIEDSARIRDFAERRAAVEATLEMRTPAGPPPEAMQPDRPSEKEELPSLRRQAVLDLVRTWEERSRNGSPPPAHLHGTHPPRVQLRRGMQAVRGRSLDEQGFTDLLRKGDEARRRRQPVWAVGPQHQEDPAQPPVFENPRLSLSGSDDHGPDHWTAQPDRGDWGRKRSPVRDLKQVPGPAEWQEEQAALQAEVQQLRRQLKGVLQQEAWGGQERDRLWGNLHRLEEDRARDQEQIRQLRRALDRGEAERGLLARRLDDTQTELK